MVRFFCRTLTPRFPNYGGLAINSYVWVFRPGRGAAGVQGARRGARPGWGSHLSTGWVLQPAPLSTPPPTPPRDSPPLPASSCPSGKVRLAKTTADASAAAEGSLRATPRSRVSRPRDRKAEGAVGAALGRRTRSPRPEVPRVAMATGAALPAGPQHSVPMATVSRPEPRRPAKCLASARGPWDALSGVRQARDAGAARGSRAPGSGPGDAGSGARPPLPCARCGHRPPGRRRCARWSLCGQPQPWRKTGGSGGAPRWPRVTKLPRNHCGKGGRHLLLREGPVWCSLSGHAEPPGNRI